MREHVFLGKLSPSCNAGDNPRSGRLPPQGIRVFLSHGGSGAVALGHSDVVFWGLLFCFPASSLLSRETLQCRALPSPGRERPSSLQFSQKFNLIENHKKKIIVRSGQAVGDEEDSLAELASAESLPEAQMEAGGYLPPVPECSWSSIPVPLAGHWSALGEAKARELRLSPEGAELQEAVGDPADCGLLSSSQKPPEGACHPHSLQTKSGARFPKFHRNVKARDPLEALSPVPACPDCNQLAWEQPGPPLSARGDGRSCHGTARLTPM